jgi:cyclohexanecarboxyl-CoA dehydrogenase
MEFGFSEQEQLFGDAVRRYARERLAPDYQKWDSGAKFPREKLRELAEVGITGLRVPEEYGGSAGSYVMAGIASEELGRYDYNTTAFVQLTSISADILMGHAKDEIKRTWLPRLATGEGLISFGLTEPGTGSDAAAITTNAKREGDYYVINGEKASITFAGMADACILFARTGGAGARGIGAILVPLDSPGVTRQVYRSAGGRLTQRGGLVFDNVRVSIDHRLGAEGAGFYQAMAAFDYNRALIALACIGAAQQSLEEAVAYAKQRRTFGKPIAEREGVSFQISEHLTMLAAARLLSYQCLTLCDQGKPHTTEAAMAKLLGPKASAEAIHACLILHGWIGYSQELPFEQRWRDVVGLEIGDGTPEIMKGIIARETFGREFNTYR